MTIKTQLLVETLKPSETKLIVESPEAGKDMWIQGIFMQGGVVNRNERDYPVTEIARAVAQANEIIKETNGIFGELDHPQTLTINMDRVSHLITELKMDGQNAIGKAKLLPTPMGLIAKACFESGARVGVSSRGTGQVLEGKVSGFNFVTCDIVAQPSAEKALPDSIYESLQHNQHGREVLTLAEQIQQDPKAQQFFKEKMLHFLRDVNWQKQ